MRIAVLSDTHFGDELCTLVRPGPDGGAAEPAPGYDALRRAVKQGALPRPFRRAVPGVIDAREKQPRLRLPDVVARPEWHSARTDYGGLFLDHITLRPPDGGGRRGTGERLVFDFAYPNLYLVTEEGESVLLTHGHYFDGYWTLLGEWAVRLAGDDLPHERPGELSVRELVGVNFPLHQFACSGIGQAQPLTALARRLQLDVLAGRTDRVARYLERLEEFVASRSLPVFSRLLRRGLARRRRARGALLQHGGLAPQGDPGRRPRVPGSGGRRLRDRRRHALGPRPLSVRGGRGDGP